MPQEMEQIFNLNFSKVFTPELYASGEEVPVKVTKAYWHRSKADNLTIALVLDHRVDIRKAPIREYLSVPNADDSEAVANNKMLTIIRMLRAFGAVSENTPLEEVDISLDLSDGPTNMLVGHEGYVVVKLREDQDGVPQNNVLRYGQGR